MVLQITRLPSARVYWTHPILTCPNYLALSVTCHKLSNWDVTTNQMSQPVRLRCRNQSDVTTCQTEMSLPIRCRILSDLIPLPDVTTFQMKIPLPIGCHNLSDWSAITSQVSKPVLSVWDATNNQVSQPVRPGVETGISDRMGHLSLAESSQSDKLWRLIGSGISVWWVVTLDESGISVWRVERSYW